MCDTTLLTSDNTVVLKEALLAKSNLSEHDAISTVSLFRGNYGSFYLQPVLIFSTRLQNS